MPRREFNLYATETHPVRKGTFTKEGSGDDTVEKTGAPNTDLRFRSPILQIQVWVEESIYALRSISDERLKKSMEFQIYRRLLHELSQMDHPFAPILAETKDAYESFLSAPPPSNSELDNALLACIQREKVKLSAEEEIRQIEEQLQEAAQVRRQLTENVELQGNAIAKAQGELRRTGDNDTHVY
eukprot:gnl/Chilomastix_cuspidata/2231.p1 GENE.gnl/Chilomastix_cuspidata/2231~~gnl/Chilomastix_cuspidata/2231.p1  ORF type:complete len:192 (-),score=12.63 gnl/Chilomastix_cuspidata/2231:400-954(-)